MRQKKYPWMSLRQKKHQKTFKSEISKVHVKGCNGNLEDRTIKDYWITKGETFGYADEMARKAREQEKEVRRKKANTSS